MTSTTLCLGFNQAAHPVVSTWDLDAYGYCHDCQKAAQRDAAERLEGLRLQAERPSVVWVVEVFTVTSYGTSGVDYSEIFSDRQEALDECWRAWTCKQNYRYTDRMICRVVPFVRADWSGASLTVPIGGDMRAVITPDMYRI